MQHFALGIAVEILFERNEQKDWNGKPDRRERPKHFQGINNLLCSFSLLKFCELTTKAHLFCLLILLSYAMLSQQNNLDKEIHHKANRDQVFRQSELLQYLDWNDFLFR